MNSNLKTKTFQVTLGTVFLVLILALPAIACSGIRSGHSFILDLLMSLESSNFYMYGLPLLASVCIELFILSQRERISYYKAFLITATTNIVYIFMGYLSIGFFESYYFFPINLIGSTILSAMCVSFCQRTGYFKYLSQGWFVFIIYLFFISLGFAESLIVETINISTPITFLYAGTSGILLIRFIINFVIKGYAISLIFRLIFKKKSPSLADTVLSMHVSSYPIIAMAYYLSSL